MQLPESKLLPCRRYVLTCNVANPRLDRREKYDVSRLPWTAGMTFFVSKHGRALEKGPSHVPPAHPGYEALAAALELLPENALDVMSEVEGDDARRGSEAKHVLNRLYAQGIITREQLVATTQAVLAEEY